MPYGEENGLQSLWYRDNASATAPYLFERNTERRKGVSTVPCTTYQTTDKEKGPSTAATVKSH